jgi:hypothetical protein
MEKEPRVCHAEMPARGKPVLTAGRWPAFPSTEQLSGQEPQHYTRFDAVTGKMEAKTLSKCCRF